MKLSENISNELMAKGWRALQAYRKIHTKVGSTDYKFWYKSLSEDFTAEQFMGGVKLAQDFEGFLDLPAFRALCRSTKRDRSHELFLPEPKRKIISKKEFHKKIKELKDSLGLK